MKTLYFSLGALLTLSGCSGNQPDLQKDCEIVFSVDGAKAELLKTLPVETFCECFEADVEAHPQTDEIKSLMSALAVKLNDLDAPDVDDVDRIVDELSDAHPVEREVGRMIEKTYRSCSGDLDE